MKTTLDNLTRQQAANFLQQFREARANGRIVEALLLDGSDWEHPRSRELSERANQLETAIEGLLQSRARA